MLALPRALGYLRLYILAVSDPYLGKEEEGVGFRHKGCAHEIRIVIC